MIKIPEVWKKGYEAGVKDVFKFLENNSTLDAEDVETTEQNFKKWSLNDDGS